MPLHRTKRKILSAIATGINSEPALAEELDALMDVIRYHLESLEEDGYIKCRRGAPTETTSDRLWIYEIWLTPKAEDAIAAFNEERDHDLPVQLAAVPMNAPPKPGAAPLEDSQRVLLEQAVTEICRCIQQLETRYPEPQTVDAYKMAARVIRYIESNQTLKEYAIAAVQNQLLQPTLKESFIGELVLQGVQHWARKTSS